MATNTMYADDRYTTEEHKETLKVNGWTFCLVDIMDEFGSVPLPVRGGKHLSEVYMGKAWWTTSPWLFLPISRDTLWGALAAP